MAFGNTSDTSLIGFVFGLTSSIGFAVFSVTLRWRKEHQNLQQLRLLVFLFCYRSIVILSKDYVFFQQVIIALCFLFMVH